jgi:hypothetical protein
MQLEPCERPSRDAVCPRQADAPARYLPGAASGCPGRPHQRALPPPTSASPPVAVGRTFSCRKTRGKWACFRSEAPAPIRPITGRRWLLPSSCTRRRISAPCGVLTQRDDDGLTTFRRCTMRRLGRVSSPRERHLRAASSECRSLSPCHFDPGLSASLACHH